MYNALDIADYIIDKYAEEEHYTSNLKLQKILYFVQAEFLVAKGEPCFSDKIEAWDFGPVVPKVYYEYNIYGAASIFGTDKNREKEYITKPDRKLIDDIIKECKKYSTADIVKLTQSQTPWIKAYKKEDKTISNESIEEFFRED